MLIVEDDPVILMTAAFAMRAAGFVVLEAETADAGAEIVAARFAEIAAVFSDIETPGSLDGLALARLIEQKWPTVRVLLTSGRVTPTAEALPSRTQFLSKPYDVTHVSRLVRDLIDG